MHCPDLDHTRLRGFFFKLGSLFTGYAYNLVPRGNPSQCTQFKREKPWEQSWLCLVFPYKIFSGFKLSNISQTCFSLLCFKNSLINLIQNPNHLHCFVLQLCFGRISCVWCQSRALSSRFHWFLMPYSLVVIGNCNCFKTALYALP